MKIGLLFGSFNPIHIAHLIIANYIADFYTEKIWFIVSPQNPLKKTESLLDANIRLKLVQLAIASDNRFETSDIEFDLPKPSYTINTLQAIKTKFPQHEFFLILGSDNYLNLSSWKSHQQIKSDYKILVYDRPNAFLNRNFTEPNVEFLNAPLIGISSTLIRKLLSENKSAKYLLPEKVYQVIKANNYYR